MFRYLLLNEDGDIGSYIIQLLLCLPIIFLSLSLHETAHGFIAYKLGDPTARNLGRLTLNPIKHLDPIGFICMLLAGFGWAKPVPIETRNFKKPRRDIALTSVAGPVSNLLLALIFVVIYRLSYIPLASMIISNAGSTLALLADYALIFLSLAIFMNINLAIFNLLPIPPLDGSKILYMFLPTRIYFKIAPYERYISIVFMILLATGVISPLLSTVTNFIVNLMMKIAWLI